MGFDIENVKRALVHFKGDEQAAAEAILMGTPLPPTGHDSASAYSSVPVSRPWSEDDARQFR